MRKTKINFCLAACDLGVKVDGASLGPEVIAKKLDQNKVHLVKQNKDYQKEKEDGNLCRNYKELSAYLKALYDKIDELYDQDKDIILLGGDHATAIASALGSLKHHKDIGILWIDAHSDYHTFDTTTSGNLHGVPLAEINGLNKQRLRPFDLDKRIRTDQTAIYGARSIDEGEYLNLEKTDVKVIGIKEAKKDVETSLIETIKKIDKGQGIHVSFDLDSLDPSIAPGVSTPVEEGFDYDELKAILKVLKMYRDKIVSFDLCEYNPLNDQDEKTLKIALMILDIFK